MTSYKEPTDVRAAVDLAKSKTDSQACRISVSAQTGFGLGKMDQGL